jgi:hypothetical protein
MQARSLVTGEEEYETFTKTVVDTARKCLWAFGRSGWLYRIEIRSTESIEFEMKQVPEINALPPGLGPICVAYVGENDQVMVPTRMLYNIHNPTMAMCGSKIIMAVSRQSLLIYDPDSTDPLMQSVTPQLHIEYLHSVGYECFSNIIPTITNDEFILCAMSHGCRFFRWNVGTNIMVPTVIHQPGILATCPVNAAVPSSITWMDKFGALYGIRCGPTETEFKAPDIFKYHDFKPLSDLAFKVHRPVYSGPREEYAPPSFLVATDTYVLPIVWSNGEWQALPPCTFDYKRKDGEFPFFSTGLCNGVMYLFIACGNTIHMVNIEPVREAINAVAHDSPSRKRRRTTSPVLMIPTA